jgi:hypothetical protein
MLRRLSFRAAAFALYLTRMRLAGGAGSRSCRPSSFHRSRRFPEKLEKLNADQCGRLALENGDDPTDLGTALKAAAGSLMAGVGAVDML